MSTVTVLSEIDNYRIKLAKDHAVGYCKSYIFIHDISLRDQITKENVIINLLTLAQHIKRYNFIC